MRRVIASAALVQDGTTPEPVRAHGDRTVTMLWAASQVPTSYESTMDGWPTSGVTVLHVELDPGATASPLHRTDTVDVVHVVSGHLGLELEGTDDVELGPGDSVVQLGTVHAWRNARADTPVSYVVVMIEAG